MIYNSSTKLYNIEKSNKNISSDDIFSYIINYNDDKYKENENKSWKIIKKHIFYINNNIITIINFSNDIRTNMYLYNELDDLINKNKNDLNTEKILLVEDFILLLLSHTLKIINNISKTELSIEDKILYTKQSVGIVYKISTYINFKLNTINNKINQLQNTIIKSNNIKKQLSEKITELSVHISNKQNTTSENNISDKFTETGNICKISYITNT